MSEKKTVWWMVSAYGFRVTPVEVVSVTDKTITYLEYTYANMPPRHSRSKIHSSHYDFFPTITETVQFLDNRIRREREAHAKNESQYAETMAELEKCKQAESAASNAPPRKD